MLPAHTGVDTRAGLSAADDTRQQLEHWHGRDGAVGFQPERGAWPERARGLAEPLFGPGAETAGFRNAADCRNILEYGAQEDLRLTVVVRCVLNL
ncbi:hypothetical protein ACRAWG_31240 [Methylobacterium sp. P31]